MNHRLSAHHQLRESRDRNWTSSALVMWVSRTSPAVAVLAVVATQTETLVLAVTLSANETSSTMHPACLTVDVSHVSCTVVN